MGSLGWRSHRGPSWALGGVLGGWLCCSYGPRDPQARFQNLGLNPSWASLEFTRSAGFTLTLCAAAPVYWMWAYL